MQFYLPTTFNATSITEYRVRNAAIPVTPGQCKAQDSTTGQRAFCFPFCLTLAFGRQLFLATNVEWLLKQFTKPMEETQIMCVFSFVESTAH